MDEESFKQDFKRLKISDIQPQHFPGKRQAVHKFGHLERMKGEAGSYLGDFRHAAGALINH